MNIEGIFCASFTAFGPDGAVDHARSTAHAATLIEAGCDGVALLGTTGEANSLSSPERMALLEAVVAAGLPPERLLPGTGLCSVPETVALTRHALDCGVRTVLLLPPFYYAAPTQDGLLAHYSRVLDEVADDRLSVLLYNIPQMTGVSIEPDLIEQLRRRFPGTVVGIKDSSGDLGRMTALVERFPGFAVLAGADPLVGPLLRAGGAGGITATANLIAPLLAHLYRRIRAGEDAGATAALEQRIADLRALFQRWPQIPALKAGHALLSGEPGWANVRPPMMPLDADEMAALETALATSELQREKTEMNA